MTLETRTDRAAPVAPQPRALARGGVAERVPLPPGVADILRERGVADSPVLLLADGAARRRGRDTRQGPAVAYGALDEAATLLGVRSFAAVVLTLEGTRASQLQPLLATLAPNLAPGVLLVAVVAGLRGSDPREAVHLSMLRSGFHEVWVHSHRTQLYISARRATIAPGVRSCSIIVPVFNEWATFPQLMRALLDKRLEHLGLEREIILVESNSTDGTRELVAGFAGTPGVRVLWEDRPRGKGHAVRAGLEVARGDVVLIQDADLEYDLNDYDALLEPLLQQRAAFVLGSRYDGSVRMRRFTDQRMLGEVLDTAHLFFAGVINVLYGQSLKDPFTMFKVFRRDCLYGLQFECDRFDFDHELLIKLLLKGYRPLEIPVSYRARSFRQGKKIRFFRDPPTWIAADLKFRLRRLRPRFG